MKKSKRKKTDINVKIGKRLKLFRKKNEISADELASAFGIVKDSLLRIENGSTGLSGEYAYILATRYNCDMNYLFGGVIPNNEFYNVGTGIREDDNERLAESLHYIADLIRNRENPTKADGSN